MLFNFALQSCRQQIAMTSKTDKSNHWQGSKATLTERGAHLLETGVFSDVEFLVGDGGNMKTVSAHKLILSIGSPVFAAMFQFPSKEIEPITVTDISPNNFLKMLRYLYTDDLSLGENIDEVLELCYAAKKYMITNLENECIAHFQSLKLYPEIVCRIYETANILGIQPLRDRCVTFISSSTTEVLRSAEFINAKQETVQMILKMEKVSTDSEVEFFSALLAWGLAECSRKNLEPNFTSLKVIVKPLIPHIRFLAMSIEEFTRAMNEAEDLFDYEETLAIYIKIANLHTERFGNLPSWCNRAGSRYRMALDLFFKINFESNDMKYFNLSSCLWGKRLVFSTLNLQSLKSNLVIKGIKLLWLGLQEKEDVSMPNERTTEHHYKLTALNLSSRITFKMEGTLITGKEILIIFSSFLPVASGESAGIEVSIDMNKSIPWERVTEGERKTEEFRIKLSCDNMKCKRFAIKELIYFLRS